ncbi:MAG TPA: 16S rRNA (guanine(527)-N(7))-methyltransferase RsmG [Isosphaeraceae bacterium]|nr:16S rRNA (guanine(527)-N(7))-methyltransferase RsmG [Isosphaeraceae bacterium]
MTPGPKALDAILKQCGIRLDGVQIGLLWRYHQMLRAANAQLNLTRIHNFENMVLKHYVDSLLVLRFVELPSPLLDLGTGPGLPGIPLKIARPQVRMILAEPRGARAAFLRQVRGELNLPDVEVYPHTVGPNDPGRVAGVISRAVGSIPETLERVASCLEPGGRMIFMKGPACDDEVAEARQAQSGLFRLAADHAYEIPGTTHRRRLVLFERLEGQPAQPQRPHAMAVEFGGSIREITSAANPTYKQCRELLGGSGIRKHGVALLAGSRIRAEILAQVPEQVLGWLTDSQGDPPPSPSIPWLRLSDPLFRELDVSGTHAPLLLVKVPAIPTWSDEDSWPTGCTLFVPFQDPENVGAVIRSAAAFGVARVVLLREAAHPFHPRSSRAAGPALFRVPLFKGPRLADLHVQNAPLIALDTTGPELSETPFPERFGLVVGVEGPGLPAHLREGPRRRIAMQPGIESLNAAAATAIALYVWSLRG